MNKLFLILLSFFYLCTSAQSKEIISTQNGEEIDIFGKSVAYVYKGKQISKERVQKLKQKETFFYPLRFILIATDFEKHRKYDYVFYVYNTHQEIILDIILNDKNKQKILRQVR